MRPRLRFRRAVQKWGMRIGLAWAWPAVFLVAAAQGPDPARVAVRVAEPIEVEAAIARKKEHCSADAATLKAVGRSVGEQVRIVRKDGESGLFTVMARHPAGSEPAVGVGRLGRLRIGSSEPFEAAVGPDVTHSHLSDAEAKAQGDFVERLDDDGRNARLLVMAPHGGQIEVPTDLQAERVAAKVGADRVTLWRCRGFGVRGGKSAFERWHITSTEISEASFPLLARLRDRRFEHAVSFHGMTAERILVGGMGPTRLKVEIRDAIRAAIADPSIPVDLALPGEANGGTTPTNIVNRYCRGTGIQIEQSPKARRLYWEKIADAVAGVYRARLDP